MIRVARRIRCTRCGRAVPGRQYRREMLAAGRDHAVCGPCEEAAEAALALRAKAEALQAQARASAERRRKGRRRTPRASRSPLEPPRRPPQPERGMPATPHLARSRSHESSPGREHVSALLLPSVVDAPVAHASPRTPHAVLEVPLVRAYSVTPSPVRGVPIDAMSPDTPMPISPPTPPSLDKTPVRGPRDDRPYHEDSPSRLHMHGALPAPAPRAPDTGSFPLAPRRPGVGLTRRRRNHPRARRAAAERGPRVVVVHADHDPVPDHNHDPLPDHNHDPVPDHNHDPVPDHNPDPVPDHNPDPDHNLLQPHPHLWREHPRRGNNRRHPGRNPGTPGGTPGPDEDWAGEREDWAGEREDWAGEREDWAGEGGGRGARGRVHAPWDVVGAPPSRSPARRPWHGGLSRDDTHTPAVGVAVINTGYLSFDACFRSANGAANEADWVPVLVFLIDHPAYGMILFDLGLSGDLEAGHERRPRQWASSSQSLVTHGGEGGDARFKRFTRAYRDLLTATEPPLYDPQVRPGQSLVSQLRAAGIDPGDIRTVVYSHTHFDHATGTGTIAAFPNADLYVGPGVGDELARGALLVNPADFDAAAGVHELSFQEDAPAFARAVGPFAHAYDLVGDGSVLLVPTPGHCRGHLSALVHLASGWVCLAGDAVFGPENYACPSLHDAPVAKGVMDLSHIGLGIRTADADRDAARASLEAIQALARHGVRIWPSHDVSLLVGSEGRGQHRVAPVAMFPKINE